VRLNAGARRVDLPRLAGLEAFGSHVTQLRIWGQSARPWREAGLTQAVVTSTPDVARFSSTDPG
jgi:hypothetical protein